MRRTASSVYDEKWGYAAILLTDEEGGKQYLKEIVIEDDDVPGYSAGDLAEAFIEWAEAGEYPHVWDTREWDHLWMYKGFLKEAIEKATEEETSND